MRGGSGSRLSFVVAHVALAKAKCVLSTMFWHSSGSNMRGKVGDGKASDLHLRFCIFAIVVCETMCVAHVKLW